MDTQQQPVPALVLGTGLTVLGTLRCLAALGVGAYCLSDGLGFEASSRWCRTTTVRVGAGDDADGLAGALDALPFERGVIFSCSDHWTTRLERLPSALSQRFVSSVPSAGVIDNFVDKGAFGRLLREAGVPHPATESIAGEDELSERLAKLPAGVFLKPSDSQAFLRTFRVKAFRVSTVDDALQRYRSARAAGLELLLQEYIPGPPDRHYFVDGFVDRNHEVAAAFARRRLRMHPPDFGNSSSLVSEPLDVVGDALESLRSLFALAQYRGIFSAEFKRDERDGVLKIIEVNCRPWWYVEFAARCGVNVVDHAYRDALGMGAPDRQPYRTGAHMVHTYYDYYACRRMHREGSLSLRSWGWSWLTAQKPVFRIDDPAPAVSKLTARIRGRMRVRSG